MTPGSRPCKISEKLLMGKFCNWAVEIDPILFPNCFFAMAEPVPVTTISFKIEAEYSNSKSTVTSAFPILA